MSELRISQGSHSISGLKPVNEDACGLHIPGGSLLEGKGIAAVIADGMSGAVAGHEASQTSVTSFLSDYFSTSETWSVKKSVHTILTALNRWLYSQGHASYGTSKGLVCTFSAVVIKSTTAHIFHVGDSRVYLYRNDGLECLTNDHQTTVGDRCFLSRALGIDLNVDIDYKTVPVEKGDRFLLTTDGMHGFLNDQHIQKTLATDADDTELCQSLVAQALDNSSDDNLTCLTFQITELPASDEDAFYRQLTALPFPPPLQPGMILDGYRIIREIHASKRTELYLAFDIQNDQQVVMKTPSVNYEDDALFIDLFLHEEWIGRRADNPHIMKVMKVERKRQCLYTITEYIEGQTLRQWMEQHPLPAPLEVQSIIEQLIKGLRAFQRLEMIHQDLKPENIMIDLDGTVKIIDFGSTKVAGLGEISTPLDQNSLLGTENYTAPEYLLGQQPTNRSDIFSLGVIIYELYTGKLPYSDTLTRRNLNRVQYQHACDINDQLPPWMDQTLAKAVQRNPELRYDSLSELQRDLTQANPKFLKQARAPLMERNPLLFWKVTAAVLCLTNLIQLVIFLG
ncbi:MAG: bifunctional protein-serine/threonine kinase/phosphatase [Pseudomonadales bacterium]|nr:bifunctional protein-serine/threonine kinase/phosphatase [Pseudomonadales bacterium]